MKLSCGFLLPSLVEYEPWDCYRFPPLGDAGHTYNQMFTECLEFLVSRYKKVEKDFQPKLKHDPLE